MLNIHCIANKLYFEGKGVSQCNMTGLSHIDEKPINRILKLSILQKRKREKGENQHEI